MNDKFAFADAIIALLRHQEVDGETMEYIINRVGMRDQMINQLYLYPLQYEAEQRARAIENNDTPTWDL